MMRIEQRLVATIVCMVDRSDPLFCSLFDKSKGRKPRVVIATTPILPCIDPQQTAIASTSSRLLLANAIRPIASWEHKEISERQSGTINKGRGVQADQAIKQPPKAFLHCLPFPIPRQTKGGLDLAEGDVPPPPSRSLTVEDQWRAVIFH